jgi:hypothetical protein
MSPRLRSALLYLALVALFLLHNDLWLWNDHRLVLGLPVGLVYHIGFCVASSVVLTLLVIYAWPAHLDREAEPEGETARETFLETAPDARRKEA